MAFLLLASFLAFVSLAAAQVPYFTGCPQVSVMENFSAESYLGTWYEYEKYPFIFEVGGKCITAEYTYRPDGKIGVTNRQLNRILGSENSINGYAEADVGEPAKLTVTFPSVSANGSPYWVLGTDYESYAVVWSCTEYGGLASTRVAWILTRDQMPKIETVQKAYEVFDKNGISKSFLMKTNHEGCKTDMMREHQ
ncbi:apolipoprotein D-like [Culicoides brevitarsis]|uniref:apolipoprotein D-like n=1 Tax=Culicoides brevitarsis TaxID=469753 RepID=UPI00307C4E93